MPYDRLNVVAETKRRKRTGRIRPPARGANNFGLILAAVAMLAIAAILWLAFRKSDAAETALAAPPAGVAAAASAPLPSSPPPSASAPATGPISVPHNPKRALELRADAQGLVKAGKLEAAIDKYRESLAFAPEDAETHAQIALALGSNGQADDAMVHLIAAVQLDPTAAEHHSNLGAAWLLRGKTEDAVRQLREAVRLDPKLPDAQFNLGAALEKQGDLRGAQDRFKEALRLTPGDAATKESLARVTAALAKKKSA